jgi:carbamoyl-phosphate synthase large subunit
MASPNRQQWRAESSHATESSEIVFLFTSVGRRVELMRHFIGAAQRHEGRARIIGTEIDPLAPAAQLLAEELYLVPKVDDPAYMAHMRALCHDQQVTVIFPLTDPDVSGLGTHMAEADWGTTVLASVPPEHITTVSDKWRTFRWLVDQGFPTARSYLPGNVGPGVMFPLFIKPRSGSGGTQTYAVRNREELAFFSTYVKNPIIQDFLPGPEITVDAIVGRSGELLALTQRKRLMIRSGEVSRGITVFEPEVDSIVRAVVRELRPRGPITIQTMWDGKRFCVNEINARMGGGLPLSVAAGVPVGDILLASWAGDPETAIPEYQQDLVMSRFDESFFSKN